MLALPTISQGGHVHICIDCTTAALLTVEFVVGLTTVGESQQYTFPLLTEAGQAYATLMMPNSQRQVIFNGQKLQARGFKDYVSLYLGPEEERPRFFFEANRW